MSKVLKVKITKDLQSDFQTKDALISFGRGKQAGGTNERHNSQQAVCHKKQARRIQN